MDRSLEKVLQELQAAQVSVTAGSESHLRVPVLDPATLRGLQEVTAELADQAVLLVAVLMRAAEDEETLGQAQELSASLRATVDLIASRLGSDQAWR